MSPIMFPKTKTVKISQYEKVAKQFKKLRSRGKGLVEVSPWKYTLRMTKKRPLKATLRKKRAKLPKVISITKLKKKAWGYVSPDIRAQEPLCVSCGKRPTRDCGHYLEAAVCNIVYYFLRENLHGQCKYCNVILNGNKAEYRKWMVKTYGEEKVQTMENEYMASLPMNFDVRGYIQSIIDKYSCTPLNK